MEGQWGRRHLGACLGYPYSYLFHSNNRFQTQLVAPLTSGNPIGLWRVRISFKDKVVVWDSRKVAWGWQAKVPSDKNRRLGVLRSPALTLRELQKQTLFVFLSPVQVLPNSQYLLLLFVTGNMSGATCTTPSIDDLLMLLHYTV